MLRRPDPSLNSLAPHPNAQASDVKVDPNIKARCSKGEFRAEHLFHLRLAYLAAKKTDSREIQPVPADVQDLTERYLSGKGSIGNDSAVKLFLDGVTAVEKRALASNFTKVELFVEDIVVDPKKVPGTVQSLGLMKQKSGTLGLGVIYEMIFPGDTAPKPVQVKPEVLKRIMDEKKK
jgi:hypothetical protein